ncbi:MAG TPA: hypothetical protein PKE00_06135 [Planctomycetota bacterium]|nr:hypothetical protein [Planctomycetota bacterium]
MRNLMSRAFLGLVVAGLAPSLATAQDQDAMKENLEKKLASEFLKKTNWKTDYAATLAAAKKSGEVIFAYFTRSYAP